MESKSPEFIDDHHPKPKPFLMARECKFAEARLQSVEADGTFCGYASVFGSEDLGRDILMPGAFKKSLARSGTGDIRMLFQHDPNEPIGVWEVVREDARGLFVKGRLTLDVERAREVHALMKDGGLNGLSIGFKTVRANRDKPSGKRQIFEVDLWEISVVTFPMLPEAKISSVKSDLKFFKSKNLPTTRQFERWLMRDVGLSRKEARTVIGSGFKALHGARDAAGMNRPMQMKALTAIRTAAQKMREATRTR